MGANVADTMMGMPSSVSELVPLSSKMGAVAGVGVVRGGGSSVGLMLILAGGISGVNVVLFCTSVECIFTFTVIVLGCGVRALPNWDAGSDLAEVTGGVVGLVVNDGVVVEGVVVVAREVETLL